MVVENETIVAEDIKYKLETFGYEVPAIAVSGEEAVKLDPFMQPDLILMDIRMPGKLDGVEAAAKIKETRDVPVVFLTAFADTATVSKAKIAYPFGYIIKPFGERELHAAIDLALYKHRIEMKLKQSESKYRTLFDKAVDGIMIGEVDGRFIMVNDAFAEMHGYGSPDRMQHMSLTDLCTSESAKLATERMSRVLGGEKISFEVEHYHSDGHIFPLSVTCNLIEIEGKPCFLGFHRDISDQKRAAATLKESEERFRSLVECAPEGVYVQSNGRIVYLNPGARRLFGASEKDDLTGAEFIERVAPEYRESVRLRIRFQRDTGKPAELIEQEYLRLDGSRVPVEVTAVPVRFQGCDSHLVVVRDITERKQAEQVLRRKVDELERFNALMVGREIRMVEMKKEVNALLKASGQHERYKVD
jgi:PAS domain S-box-containing protein